MSDAKQRPGLCLCGEPVNFAYVVHDSNPSQAKAWLGLQEPRRPTVVYSCRRCAEAAHTPLGQPAKAKGPE